MGWDFRILDGQGSVPARTSALTQAIALQPDGIILGTIDAAEQAPIIEQAIAAGIKVVGWHAGPGPGKIEAVPGVFTNITTDPNEVANYKAVKDPLMLFRRRVTEAGLLDGAAMDEIDRAAKSRIAQCVAEAKSAPLPTEADLLTDVYVSY